MISKLLVAYLRAPDHPAKLRIFGMIQTLLGHKRLIARTVHEFRMALDQADLIQRCILYSGNWEPEISSFLQQELTEDDVFYDVGANVGFTSFVALTKGVKHVFAFEPDPINLQVFNTNLNLNKDLRDRCTIIGKAISESPGRLSFTHAPSANMGLGKLSSSGGSNTIEVDVTTLDAFVAGCEGVIAPTVIKIDVEGWELQVLRGGIKTITNHRPRLIVFEADCDAYGNMVDGQLEEFFNHHNYTFHRIGSFDSKANYVASACGHPDQSSILA